MRSESDSLLGGDSKRRYSMESGASASLQNLNPSGKSSFYKNPHYLSESAFQTLTQGIADQIIAHDAPRSQSMGDIMHDLADHDDKVSTYVCIKRCDDEMIQGRRVLYGALPYIATYGMQNRESVIKNVIRQASHRNLEEAIDISDAEAARKVSIDNISHLKLIVISEDCHLSQKKWMLMR